MISIRNPWLRRTLEIRELGPLLLLVLFSAGFNFAGPAFLTPMNVSNMLSYVPELGIIALGMTLLITAGEMDLTVGAIFAFCPVLMFIFYNQHVMPLELAFVVVMVLAALIGLVNGLLVTKLHMSSFITTIGMQLVVRGAALYVSNGFPQATWKTATWIKQVIVGEVAKFGDFSILTSLFWFAGLAALAHFILRNTRFGNWLTATGGNVKAASARGVNTDGVKIVLFIVCALAAGFAGIMDTFRIESAYPVSGTGYELEVIAMVVIGGTLLYGGRGSIIGTVIGVFLLRIIRNGIIVVGVPGLAYNIFVGAIILLMMALHATIEHTQTGGD